MTPNRITFIAAIIAALLTWTAMAIRYVRRDTIDWPTLAIGFFVLALAFYYRKRPDSRWSPRRPANPRHHCYLAPKGPYRGS